MVLSKETRKRTTDWLEGMRENGAFDNSEELEDEEESKEEIKKLKS